MRIDVHKYLLLGPEKIRAEFFKKVQELGIVEFISDRPPSLETPPDIQSFVDALHILRQMPTTKEYPTEDFHSANMLARHIVERKTKLEEWQEKVRVLEKDISRIEVFGDFSLDTIQEIEKKGHRVIQFFFTKKSDGVEAVKRPEVIYVGSQYGLNYYMSINKKRTSYDGLIEIVFDKSLGDLKMELAETNKKIDEYETELQRLAHYKKMLKAELTRLLNKFHLEDAKKKVSSLLEGDIFAIEGWVPDNKVKELEKLADQLNVHFEPVKIEKENRIPTYLENTNVGRLGEDLIGIYDTPSHTDRDPSLWVFGAFAVFFSMIVADAGYGLIFLGMAIWFYFKYGKKPGLGRRLIFLLGYLAIGCIIWGVLNTSFFGIEFAENSKIRRFSLVNWMIERKADYFLQEKPQAYHDLLKDYPELNGVTDPKEFLTKVKRKQEGVETSVVYNTFQGNVLIEIAIFVGAIHILLSFLRYLDRNWTGFGWILFLIGGYLYFPSLLGSISLIHYVFHVPYEMGALVGKYMIYAGLGAVVVLGVIQKKLAGLGDIMHVISVFADVMSYLRIYALSLAGMIMAATFNRIGMKLPIYIGIFIIIAGHLINITLAVMGGIIHGLRLNFIEWYHYSFEGGGKKFDPLKLIKSD